ncbi:MAG: DNA/RNA non-specific endonuclease, partial [Muribaculaceae bacterium]|nr:DNA/RNA non-specific endonuclease [Muribaculaceae bacterium]
FKVLLAPYVENPRGIAFVYPNMTSPGNMEDYAMSIDDLEKQLGYDFFPALPDNIEKKVEATYSFSDWNSTK